jgi:hypothetical protein
LISLSEEGSDEEIGKLLLALLGLKSDSSSNLTISVESLGILSLISGSCSDLVGL